ncbi:hypothetical protein DBV15_05405 [Temnothorax longispinosus]|uniref:Uncharacterized protein n=1 Tax=Temnothorax longispinosus TaxID=300112 RepID=A0A4S2JAW2_9HYME|nr:hypothetical protein DBV15_05405 [Temnothorax longispinosus]
MGVVAWIPLMHPAVVMVMLRRGRRVVLMLGRRARGRHAGRLGVIAAGAAGPQRFGTVVKVTGGRGSLHHEIENRRAAHHLDGPLKRKIGEPLPVAPDYHVAGLQASCSRGTAFPRALKIHFLLISRGYLYAARAMKVFASEKPKPALPRRLRRTFLVTPMTAILPPPAGFPGPPPVDDPVPALDALEEPPDLPVSFQQFKNCGKGRRAEEANVVAKWKSREEGERGRRTENDGPRPNRDTLLMTPRIRLIFRRSLKRLRATRSDNADAVGPGMTPARLIIALLFFMQWGLGGVRARRPRRDDGTAACKSQIATSCRKIYYAIADKARGQWMHVVTFLARGDSTTTCAFVRKDVPLRSSISPKQSNQKLTNCYQTCLKYRRRFASRGLRNRVSAYTANLSRNGLLLYVQYTVDVALQLRRVPLHIDLEMRPVHSARSAPVFTDPFRTIDLPRSATMRRMHKYCSKSNKDARRSACRPQIVKHAQRDPAAGYRPGINPSRLCPMTIALACWLNEALQEENVTLCVANNFSKLLFEK